MAELLGFEPHVHGHRSLQFSSNIEHKLSNFVAMNYRATFNLHIKKGDFNTFLNIGNL